MDRTLLGAALLASALASPPAAAQLPRLGCDPITYETPEPVPAGQEMVCGDGRRGTYTAFCSRSCAGGCEGVSGCGPVSCMTATEVCDGDALGGASCRSLGFLGGALACAATCDGLDTSGCSICRAGSCREHAVSGPIEAVRIVPGRAGALLVWRVPGGLRFAIAGEDLTLTSVTEVAPAELFDVQPFGDGWLLASAAAGAGRLERVAADGTRTELEALAPDVTDVALWALDGGGAVVTTGGARGAPIHVYDASGARTTPSLPTHATRADGGRMILLDRTCDGVLAAAPPHTALAVDWAPEAADFAVAFARPSVAGAQIVRAGAMWRGLGLIEDGTPSLRVHCGPAPRVSGRRGDPLWDAAVPDEPPTPGAGWIDLHLTGRRYRDAFEPDDGGAPIVFTGSVPDGAPVTPRRALFADHESVRVLGHARVGRQVLGVALVDRAGTTTLAVARGR